MTIQNKRAMHVFKDIEEGKADIFPNCRILNKECYYEDDCRQCYIALAYIFGNRVF